jgi:tetratricopeptide (TPR) repeat protein
VRAAKAEIPEKGTVYLALADAYEKVNNTALAAKVLTEYTAISGVRNQDASYRKAVLHETLDPSIAARMYEENTIVFPKDHRNFLKLGIFYSRQKNGDSKAILALEKCAALVDTIPILWYELGNLYARGDKNSQMIKAYQKFIQVSPGNADACSKIGETLVNKNLDSDAVLYLEMANSLKPNEPKIMSTLAKAYIRTNRKQEGVKILDKIVKMSKGDVDPSIRMSLADVYMASKRDNKMLLAYANALLKAERFADAENAIEDIKATNPEDLDANMLLGEIKVAQKKYDDAIETYKEVLYIKADYAPALYARAEVYMMQSKIQWAKTFYERAIKADVNFGLAELGLAKIAKIQKDMTAYQNHLTRAQKLSPNDPLIQQEIAASKK